LNYGAGILEMQACDINGNATGIELNRINGASIKINRSKFSNNIVDAANTNPADAILPDFRWNWWSSSAPAISGQIDFSRRVEGQMRDPVVVVPGIALSEKEFFGMGEWKIDPILHTYDNLIETLQANGYVKDKDLFVFPYDWRNSNVVSAQLLRTKISEIRAKNNGWPKIDIISHSMGGLVAREYIESDYYQNDVDQLVTLATPQNGASIIYLTWEDGSFDPNDIMSYFSQKHYSHLASAASYWNIFDYIHQWPITSVEELLPVYSYLYDADNNDALRIYPQNYPANIFLQKLNTTDNLKKLEKVEFDKIIAVDEGKTDTITGYRVKNYVSDNHWVNGKPVDWGVPFLQEQSIYRGSGDNTVPFKSAQSSNILSDEYMQIDSNHLGLVTKAQSDVFEILNGYWSGQEITRWHIPDLLDVMVHSPVDIQVVAPDGKRVGKDFNSGQILNEIEGAFYSGYEAQAEFITIPNPLIGDYKILTQGTGNGNYEIETVRYRQESENSGVQESNVAVQGSTALDQRHEIVLNAQSNGEIMINSDIIPPTVKINLPLANNYYLNNAILPIAYSVSDNKSDLDKIAIQIYFDGATTTENIIDLAFQNTGRHDLLIRAQDEAENVATTTVTFNVFSTIDSIIVNVGKFSDAGLIKRPQTIFFSVQLKALKVQFNVLDKLKRNNKLTSKSKTAAVKALELVINKQIDLLVKEIQKAAGKGITIDIVNLLVDSLKYIKIKT
jgi:pimeloyl-ACP methyl ester carboxylesterase